MIHDWIEKRLRLSQNAELQKLTEVDASEIVVQVLIRDRTLRRLNWMTRLRK